MPWLCKVPGHQQTWFGPSYPKIFQFFFSSKKINIKSAMRFCLISSAILDYVTQAINENQRNSEQTYLTFLSAQYLLMPWHRQLLQHMQPQWCPNLGLIPSNLQTPSSAAQLVLNFASGHSSEIDASWTKSINLLAPEKFEWNFRYLIFQIISMIDGWGISCELALGWMSLDLTDDKSTLVQVMTWRRQATSHYRSQCWPRSMPPYGVIRPQWVKLIQRLKWLLWMSEISKDQSLQWVWCWFPILSPCMVRHYTRYPYIITVTS